MAALLSLGMFAFEIATLPFNELQRRADWRFGTTPRVGARPASQFLGPGDDRTTLTGAIAPQIAGSFASLRTLVEMADQGEAWPLVDGSGRVLGTYRIDAVDQRQGFFIDNGVPRKADFAVDLTRVA